MTRDRDMRVVIDEMLDHIDYVLVKTQKLTITDFQHDRDLRQSVEVHST